MRLVFDEYSFDVAKRELRRGEELLKADPQHLDLLQLFLRHPGELLSHKQLIDEVWDGRAVADNVISVAIAKLRKVLVKPGARREFIENRYGRGYRFLPEVARLEVPQVPPAETTAAAEVSSRAPLVGRADALAQLAAATTDALSSQGCTCLVSGEPGIGKTRLAEALEYYVESDGRRLIAAWGRCQSDVGTPLWPVQQLMRGLAQHGLSDPSAMELLRRAVRSEAANSEEDPSAQLFGSLKSGATVEHPTLDALAQFFITASKSQPLLLLVDDIQWADSASLRLLTYLTDEISRWPILLVGTLRSAKLCADRQRELSRLWNHRNCRRIELARLKARDVDEYVRTVFGRDLPELSQELFTRSEGNPFFIVDLLRGYDRSDPTGSHPLQFSGLALEAVRQRLQEQPESARRILSAAAVLGHDFDIGLLSHVTESRPDEVLDALRGSLDNETIIASRGTAGVFAFDHELIREALYADLPAFERGRLHLRAGDGLLRRRASGGDVTSAELAHQFLSAQPHGDIELAIAHAQRAATDASRLAAHSDVRAILRRALDVLRFWVAPKPEIRSALLLQLSMVERILGDPTYRAHLELAVSLAREHRLGPILTLAGQLMSPGPGLVAFSDAARVLDDARETLDPGDSKNHAIVRAHLAWTPPNSHSALRVKKLIEEASEFAQRTDAPAAKAAVRDARLFFSASPDTRDQAEAIAVEIEQGFVVHPETASQTRSILVATFRLIMAMQSGDQPAVERAIEARASVLAQLNNVELAWHHARMLLVQRMNKGDFATIKADLIELRERARSIELHASPLLWALDYGIYLWRTGDSEAIAERVRPSLTFSSTDSMLTCGRKLRSMADFGLVDDLRAAVEQVSVVAFADLPRDREYLAVLCQFAKGAAAAESREHCEALYRLLQPYAEFYAVGVSFHCDGSVFTHLGLLSWALGRHSRAKDELARGLERELAFGLVPCAAQTALRLARLLLVAPDAAELARARRLLQQAQSDAERSMMLQVARGAREALTALRS